MIDRRKKSSYTDVTYYTERKGFSTKRLAVKRMIVWMTAGLWMAVSGCTPAPETVTKTGFALDTVISITVYGPDSVLSKGEDILTECFGEIQRYEQLFSATVESSDIARLNRAGGRREEIHAETRELLEAGIEYGKLTGGALDITIWPVSRLWDFSGADPQAPDPETLEQAVTLVDYTGLHTQGDWAWMDQAESGVDLGAIAKGYIADRLAELLRERGVDSALIDLGGNILALGEKDGGDWKIGVKDPQSSDRIAAILPVRDKSVVTSGIYQRNFTDGGQFYHHILDPGTGYPVENGLASVTIVSEKSLDGDALSTACFVLGMEKGMELIESTEGTEALFIDREGHISASSGLTYSLP